MMKQNEFEMRQRNSLLLSLAFNAIPEVWATQCESNLVTMKDLPTNSLTITSHEASRDTAESRKKDYRK